MKRSHIIKLLLFFLLMAGVIALYLNGGREYLSLEFLKDKLNEFRVLYLNNPIQSSLAYFLIYIVLTALSFPGASVLTLLAGAIFGQVTGLVIVSFASTIGSLLAFFISRFLLRSFFMEKFSQQFRTINHNIEKDGPIYLATLRLIPVFPFFVINAVMGLTAIRPWTFYWVSQLAMLPGTIVYVYAGREFFQLESLKGILSPSIIAAFFLLGTLPLIGKLIVSFLRRRKAYKGFIKPKAFDYNLIAIGAGSGGLVTSYIGAAVKSRVAIIEKDKMGGDCLNTGCVPSKALIKSAKVIHMQKRAGEFGLSDISIKFDFAEVMERVQRVVNEVEPHDSTERYESLGVECIKGNARLLDPWTISIDGKKITSKNIVIATGAKPYIPEIPGIKEARYVTSDNLWQIRELPKKFVIIGGGPIGSEMAQAFSRMGSEVTLIENGERILSKEDAAVSSLISEVFQKEGIKILTGHKLKSFQKNKIVCEYLGKDIEIEYDLILLAIGRKPNARGFGLEELGVKLRENGTIDANEYMQSSLPNIYACGDVTGPFQLTHMASHQAWYCAVNGLFPVKFKVDYSVVPWCTYTDPEVATVGETESSARNKGLAFEVTEYDIADLDRAIAENEKQGMVRVITEKGKDRILGATIVGSQASSMIVEFVAAMKNKKGLNSILGTIHVYPSFGEANKYVAGQWKKGQVKQKTLKLLERYFRWSRN